MSVLNTAARLAAGKSASPFLQEAERLLSPKGFFSKLEEAVAGLNFNKMPSQQLRKTMEGRQVSPLEYDNVLGHMEGTVSKEEVMNTISKNKTQFDDVVLGEIGKGKYGEDEMLIPHYERYSEPGYVPGSYRERFVTAPDTRLNEVRQSLKNADTLGLDAYERAQLTEEIELGKTWQDGHSAYSNIQNPVVRLRTNDREVNGKKILFVEEMQGPSPSEQAKMPEFLRKRIYDTGVKKALMLAKEGGYDGVAWTPGEIQANRYNLSKQIDTIQWSGFGKDRLWSALKDGRTVLSGNMEDAESSMGKEIAAKLKEHPQEFGELTGLDLKVGGEGLKYLYDKQIPSLMKKYGKENVSIINIEHQNPDLYSKDRLKGRPILTSVPYIPITQKTPSRHPVYSMIPPTLAGIMSMYNRDKDNGT